MPWAAATREPGLKLIRWKIAMYGHAATRDARSNGASDTWNVTFCQI